VVVRRRVVVVTVVLYEVAMTVDSGAVLLEKPELWATTPEMRAAAAIEYFIAKGICE
jgi:hypothetical protein